MSASKSLDEPLPADIKASELLPGLVPYLLMGECVANDRAWRLGVKSYFTMGMNMAEADIKLSGVRWRGI